MTDSKWSYISGIPLGRLIPVLLKSAVFCVILNNYCGCTTLSGKGSVLDMNGWLCGVVNGQLGYTRLYADYEDSVDLHRNIEIPLYAFQEVNIPLRQMPLCDLLQLLNETASVPVEYHLTQRDGGPIPVNMLTNNVTLHQKNKAIIMSLIELVGRELTKTLTQRSLRSDGGHMWGSLSPPGETLTNGTIVVSLYAERILFEMLTIPTAAVDPHFDYEPDVPELDILVPEPSGYVIMSNELGVCWIMQHRILHQSDLRRLLSPPSLFKDEANIGLCTDPYTLGDLLDKAEHSVAGRVYSFSTPSCLRREHMPYLPTIKWNIDTLICWIGSMIPYVYAVDFSKQFVSANSYKVGVVGVQETRCELFVSIMGSHGLLVDWGNNSGSWNTNRYHYQPRSEVYEMR